MRVRVLTAIVATAVTACGTDEKVAPAPNLSRSTLSGEITWQVTFDETAKAAGATDCSYTRRYVGHEDRSSPWLCPTCDRVFTAEVEVIAGLADCYAQVSPQTPTTVEYLGHAGAAWWRGGGGPMTEQGTVVIDGESVETSNTVTDLEAPGGGLLGFEVTGALTLGEEPGDPLHGFAPPGSYACGWPRADRPSYEGDFVLRVGAPVPDGLFRDACDQSVRLHDFAGRYLLIDMAAVDCPPCQAMAQEEEPFIARMAAEGIDVKVVTLLAPSLSDPLGHTTPAMIQSWSSTFGLTSPVLADRAWGLSLFYPAIGAETGYPSWTLVAPDLTVLSFDTGYGGFGIYETQIRNHAQ